jgi:pimeloyl-ACP methyl ester carboxylesterase
MFSVVNPIGKGKEMMKNACRTLGFLLVLSLIGLSGCSEAMAPGDGPTFETSQQALRGNGNGNGNRCADPDRSDNVHFARTTDKKCIAYRSFGTGDQDVILVHGWSVSGAVYDNLVAELDTSQYRLLVLDLRGTGQSDKPATGYTLDNYQKDVLAVARDARVGRFILVGHSMGGAIAQKVAAARPGRIEALVLLSPVPASGFDLPPDAYGLFHASANSAFLQEIIFNISSVALTPEDLDHLLASAATVLPAAVQESLVAWTQADFADRIFKIRTPTVVIVSDDPFLTAPILQDLVVEPIGCNASLEYFPGSGHYMLVEDAPTTAAIFDDFVDNLPTGRDWGHRCR